MPDYGFGALAIGSGAQAGLQQLIKQRLLEREMALREQAQRESTDYRNRDLELRAKERADALAEASYWKQDASDQRRQAGVERFAANDVGSTAVGSSISPERADLWSQGGQGGVIRNALTGTVSDPEAGGERPARALFRGFTPQESEKRELQATAAADREAARREAQTGREDLVRLTASMRPDPAARQRIAPIPSVNDKGESVTQGIDLDTGEVRWERPRDITASQKDRTASLGRIVPVLSGISELSEKINTGKGVVAKIAGGAARAQAEANLNDDVAEYEALISGFTPMVARAVGHSGVLTEQDVQSVKALFPRPGDSKTLRDRKIARIKTILSFGGSPEQPDAQPDTKPNGGAFRPGDIKF